MRFICQTLFIIILIIDIDHRKNIYKKKVMDTALVKKSILKSFYEVIKDLTLEEVESLKDALTVQEFRLTDDGKRYSLSEVKKQLGLENSKPSNVK